MNNKIKMLVGFLVFLLFLYLFAFLKYKDSCFILVYHRIDSYKGGLKSLYVKPKTFERQMRFLKSRGYETINLSELKHRIEKKLPLQKKFCITFDDGYNDLLNAYPILKKYEYKATVYLHIKAVLEGSYIYPKMSAAKMINVNELKNIMDIFEVGSHTITHPDLSIVSQEEVIKELRLSKEYLESLTKTKIEHFCYPFGKIFSNYDRILSQLNYQTAVTLKSGLIYSKSEIDFYALPRVEWKEISASSFKDFVKNLDFYIKIFFGV